MPNYIEIVIITHDLRSLVNNLIENVKGNDRHLFIFIFSVLLERKFYYKTLNRIFQRFFLNKRLNIVYII